MKNLVLALALSSPCFLGGFTSSLFAQTNPSAPALPILAPAGINVEKLPAVLASPRFLTFSAGGDMIVGSNAGKVYRLKAPYTTAEVLVDFGGAPHSVAFRTVGAVQELWVGLTDGVFKAQYDSTKTYTKAEFAKVVSLPGGSGHSSRTVKVGPDNHVYVSLGIAGNCSVQYLDDSYPEANRRGGIWVIDESGIAPRLVPFARGLRNAIGFNWHPTTGIMYADNNGPDHWGFDRPREVFVEVNQNSFFGMPWYQVIDDVVTPDSCAPAATAPAPASAVSLPVATFDARSAPMEVQFVGPTQLDPAWAGSALVALHGSWSVPVGGGDADRRHPKIVLVEFVEGKATGKVTDILTGFQDAAGERFARPVGLAFGPDNALYFTSDAEGAGVYRVTSEPVPVVLPLPVPPVQNPIK